MWTSPEKPTQDDNRGVISLKKCYQALKKSKQITAKKSKKNRKENPKKSQKIQKKSKIQFCSRKSDCFSRKSDCFFFLLFFVVFFVFCLLFFVFCLLFYFIFLLDLLLDTSEYHLRIIFDHSPCQNIHSQSKNCCLKNVLIFSEKQVPQSAWKGAKCGVCFLFG